MRKKIKVLFKGFYASDEDNWYLKILREKYDVGISEKPDYLFYSCLDLDAWMGYDCIRIFVSAEMITPDFNICDYAVGHDYLEFGDRYYRMPAWLAHTDLKRMEGKTNFNREDLKKKTRFCNFIYSDSSKGCEYRINLFHHISKYYKKVDSAGGYEHEIDIPEIVEGDWAYNKVEFMKKYKFTIAGENGSHRGYITEKISNAFEAQTIPIYYGCPEVAREFNPEGFINCNDYDSFEKIVDKIREIDNNDDLYIKMMQCNVLQEGIDYSAFRKGLKEFVFSIIDRPYEEAFRRTQTVFYNRVEESKTRDKRMLKMENNSFNRILLKLSKVKYIVPFFKAKIIALKQGEKK